MKLEYKLEDLDANGTPYSDAVPIGSEPVASGQKPAHWPFVPVPGERIVIELPRSSGTLYYSEEVVRVDLSLNHYSVYTTYNPESYWDYSLTYWGIGYKFSKDTGQPGVTKR